MVYFCCVNACKTEWYSGCGLTFHRIPKDESMAERWKENLPDKVTKTSVVCSLHFKDEDFVNHLRKKLKSTAIPSIFPKYCTMFGAHKIEKELVLQVINFFEKEKKHGSFTLPVAKAIERTCAATGLSKSTILRIKNYAKRMEKLEKAEVNAKNDLSEENHEMETQFGTSPRLPQGQVDIEQEQPNNSTLTIQPENFYIGNPNHAYEQTKMEGLLITNTLSTSRGWMMDNTHFVLKILHYFENEKKNKLVLPVEQAIKRICAATGLSKSTIMNIKRKAKLMHSEATADDELSIERDDQQPQASSSTSNEGFNQPNEQCEEVAMERPNDTPVKTEFQEDEFIVKVEIEDDPWPNKADSTPVECPNKDPFPSLKTDGTPVTCPNKDPYPTLKTDGTPVTCPNKDPYPTLKELKLTAQLRWLQFTIDKQKEKITQLEKQNQKLKRKSDIIDDLFLENQQNTLTNAYFVQLLKKKIEELENSES